MKQDKLTRINELSRLSRERELTAQEQEEQQALRKEYIAEYRSNLKQQLDNIVLVDEQGNTRGLKQ